MEHRQRPLLEADAVGSLPPPKAIGRRRMVRKVAKGRLQPFERVLATGPLPGGKHARENLQCIAEFLALDLQPVNLVR